MVPTDNEDPPCVTCIQLEAQKEHSHWYSWHIMRMTLSDIQGQYTLPTVFA